jgi:mannose-6-phosphate isomerase-like protein (cupin superfamily)
MLVAFLVFIVILFLYVHIQDQYKRSEDLEVYEMDYTSNEHLQSICALKQPVLFENPAKDVIKNNIQEDSVEDIRVWDTNDYASPAIKSVDPILLTYKSFANLAKSDPKGHFFTRRNQDWLEETGALDDFRELDVFVRPPLTANATYELLAGSSGAELPIQYHTADRQFFFVTEGRISVKMTPWRSSRFLNPVVDYDNYEFYSKHINVGDETKIKWLEFDVAAGHILYVPPWWWFSFRFTTVDTKVAGIQYQSFANILAHVPDLSRYYFQFHMTKHVPARTLDTESLTDSHKEILPESESI